MRFFYICLILFFSFSINSSIKKENFKKKTFKKNIYLIGKEIKGLHKEIFNLEGQIVRLNKKYLKQVRKNRQREERILNINRTIHKIEFEILSIIKNQKKKLRNLLVNIPHDENQELQDLVNLKFLVEIIKKELEKKRII